jgi:hypothetical protein
MFAASRRGRRGGAADGGDHGRSLGQKLGGAGGADPDGGIGGDGQIG